ncbi:hypothetical protein EDM57_15195 [Brevibacillus gelatini]|uniref:FAD-binding oxidoreductase/transferase type 4 C-terminal domain-containing protein n=1 Tax=Brevibacillus gelatini TaxID=1655277 RepID=A0A3M8AVQ8_9BACL|nr:hypothetical protein EDM57_15195 [Brevibacillus gelatini]
MRSIKQVLDPHGMLNPEKYSTNNRSLHF